MSKLHEVVDRLIDNGDDGRARRRLFNLDAAAYVQLEQLPAAKQVPLFKMNRQGITSEIQNSEDPNWDRLLGPNKWYWDADEWANSDPACRCPADGLQAEYPDPTPELYSLTPSRVQANTPTRVEIVGRGFVADATTVILSPPSGADVSVPLLGPIRGTYRCGRLDVLIDLAKAGGGAAETWTVSVHIMEATGGFKIKEQLTVELI